MEDRADTMLRKREDLCEQIALRRLSYEREEECMIRLKIPRGHGEPRIALAVQQVHLQANKGVLAFLRSVLQ